MTPPLSDETLRAFADQEVTLLADMARELLTLRARVADNNAALSQMDMRRDFAVQRQREAEADLARLRAALEQALNDGFAGIRSVNKAMGWIVLSVPGDYLAKMRAALTAPVGRSG